MDICHLKNSELEAKHQKYKGRVLLRGDIVKDDSGSYAVFTEQGWSASQMTAAKVMDIISRLPGCAGQAADAVSAYTQVKMEDAPKSKKIPKSECPDTWIRPPRHKWPKSWSSIEDPVVPLERNLYGHPLAGLLLESQFEKILLKYGWEKVSNCECLIRTLWKRVIQICVCGWHKIGWKETKHWSDVESTQQRRWFGRANIFPRSCFRGMYSTTMWNKQRIFLTSTEPCLNQEFPRVELKNYHARKIYVYLHGRTKWRVMPRNVWNDFVSWQTRRLNNCTKYQLHALMTIISKKKNRNSWENCQKDALKLFWNAYTWHVLDNPIFYGQWTNLHDQSQNGPKLVTNGDVVWSLTSSYFWIQTVLSCGKHCQTMQIGIVSRLRFCRRSWGFKSTSGGALCVFWKSYICSNKLDVQETNFSFTQLNRSRNHFLGCRIEVRRYSRSWFMGSDRRSSRKHVSE